MKYTIESLNIPIINRHISERIKLNIFLSVLFDQINLEICLFIKDNT